MNSILKNILVRVCTAILIVSISLGIGFSVDAICTRFEKKNNPRPNAYVEYVEKYSNMYGIPEYIIYATIKVNSDFASDSVSEDGRIGLMQIHPSTFDWLCRDLMGESHNVEMLYSPETNIKYGTYYLSYLYHEYGIWETCYAAFFAGTDNVNEWMSNPENIDENKILIQIPDEQTQLYVENILETIELYTRLYYEDIN